MSDIEYRWDESGRGAAPRQQRVVVTAAAREKAAFSAYSEHLSVCPQCNVRLETGAPFCEEARELGGLYLEAYDARRAEAASAAGTGTGTEGGR